MKKVLTETTKLFTLVCCVFVMFSCGGNDCVTCTMEGSDDVEVCEDDFPGDIGNVAFNLQLTTNRGLGFTCDE